MPVSAFHRLRQRRDGSTHSSLSSAMIACRNPSSVCQQGPPNRRMSSRLPGEQALVPELPGLSVGLYTLALRLGLLPLSMECREPRAPSDLPSQSSLALERTGHFPKRKCCSSTLARLPLPLDLPWASARCCPSPAGFSATSPKARSVAALRSQTSPPQRRVSLSRTLLFLSLLAPPAEIVSCVFP